MSTLYLPDSSHVIFPRARGSQLIYWMIILMFLITASIAPMIQLDISVRSQGMVRPVSERTLVRSMITGVIQHMYYREGSYVEKDSVIFTVRDNQTPPRLHNLTFELEQKQKFLHDLNQLTRYIRFAGSAYPKLVTSLYQDQFSRYQHLLNVQEASFAKVSRELASDSLLYRDKVIAAKEYYDKVTESKKLEAGLQAFKGEQLSVWQQQLSQAESELSQLQSAQQQLLEETTHYEVRAPVSGYLQGLSRHYEGTIVQSGDVFCELSPETDLIAECYVPTRDVGYLKINQPANFQVDAYDYNYFGVISGKIISIDNDFTMLNDIPVYKVRCDLNGKTLALKNGYSGKLKKGLRLQARFIVARRTLWQLLFDKMDDWLNPVGF